LEAQGSFGAGFQFRGFLMAFAFRGAFRACRALALGPEFDVFRDDNGARPALTGGIFPAFLPKAAYDPDAKALAPVGAAGFRKLSPRFDAEEARFHSVLLWLSPTPLMAVIGH
jgi:hypothetical protein